MIDATIAPSAFLVTKEYQRFEEFCNACARDRYIGICYGMAGVGKTLSARYFSKQHLVDEFRKEEYSTQAITELEQQFNNYRTLFYTAQVHNTPKRIEEDINRQLREHRSFIAKASLEILGKEPEQDNRHELIIIDEADRLKVNSLEQVRDIYDRKNIGIVLIGMPGMQKRLARYAQLYSRVGFSHEFRPLGKKEIYFVLEQYWKEMDLTFDRKAPNITETVALIVSATNGNFRLMVRMFSQMKRIMKINALKSIDKQLVEAARDCLVIGNS